MAGIWSVCCRVMGVAGSEERQKKKKKIIVIIIFLCLTVCRDCVRGGMGEGGFLCAGHVRCVLAGLCVGRCVLSSCLWGVLWPSRAFSCLGRVFICLFRESASERIFGGPCHFLPFFVGFAYLPHILSLCLGWGRCMFYIRTHAEGDTHIEDVRPVRGGV